VRTKQINELSVWSVEFLNVKSGDTFSDDWSLNGNCTKCGFFFRYWQMPSSCSLLKCRR